MRKNLIVGPATISLSIVFLMIVRTACAEVLIPPSLGAGDQYYLAFVTQGTTTATSPSIATYDQFVQSQAELNPSLTGTSDGVTWRALGSTALGVDAISHLDLGEHPIFLLDGTTMVASGGSELWSGVAPTGVYLTQFATDVGTQSVWTGTWLNGYAAALPLGRSEFPVLVEYAIVFGGSGAQWAVDGLNGPPTAQRAVYAFSSLLMVPVPEPATSTLAIMAAAALGGIRFAYRRTTGRASRIAAR
jgi:hypothetical protein